MTIIADNRTAKSRLSLTYAERYLKAGYCPIPVRGERMKKPVHTDWPNLRLTIDQLSGEFPSGTNVGILLGEPSSGLIDIDLDNANALKLARHFLPETEFIFGRDSKPSSHHVYKVNNPGKAKKWISPTKDRQMIVELRANGTQTVFPGSIHESGEPIEFNDPSGNLPTPSTVDRETLEIATTNIAIGSVLLDHWQPSIRHELSLHVAGFLVD
jgi:putative DNA primase/helicase